MQYMLTFQKVVYYTTRYLPITNVALKNIYPNYHVVGYAEDITLQPGATLSYPNGYP